MPLQIHKEVLSKAKLGVWKIEEEESFFSDALAISDKEKQLIAEMKGRRSIEWLSSRHLIHLMSMRDVRAVILKDEHGKPYIDDSDHYISFSHSHGMSAAIASPEVVGVDIQFIVSKIDRIAPKFMNDNEWARLEIIDPKYHIEVMHIIWGAKESLFKSYGKKSVDFRNHMDIIIEQYDGEFLSFKGNFEKEDYQESFELEAEKIDSHILVYAQKL